MANPPISASQPLVYTSYVGPDQADVVQSWLLPAGSSYGTKTPATPLQLPALYSGQGQPTDINYTNDDFIVTASYNGKPVRENVSIALSLTGKNAWSNKATARTALRANYLDFLIAIERKGLLGTPTLLVAGAMPIISMALLQLIPMPLGETLFFACGLDTGIASAAAASVDVMGGMRLRREPSSRQYVAPPSQAFAGYQATGTLGWIATTGPLVGGAMQSFDAFLGALASPQITPPTPSAPLYNLTDLQLAGSSYRYHRLIFPHTVAAAAAPGTWSASESIVLVGGDTLAEVRGTAPPYSRSFFGREVVVPEICVWSGLPGGPLQPLYVPLGTTVANLIERFTRWRPLSTTAAANTLQLQRLVCSRSGMLQSQSVLFAPVSSAMIDLAALDLPLWPGDALQLKFPLLANAAALNAASEV